MGVHLSTELVKPPEEGGLIGAMEDGGKSLGSAIGDGFKGLLGGIANALRGIFDHAGIFAGIGQAAELFRDGQTALNDRTDLLNSKYGDLTVIFNRGCASASTRQGSGASHVVVDRIIGPHQGCRLVNGEWVLDEEGCWNVNGQATVTGSTIGLLARVELQIEVFTPEGKPFSVVRRLYTSTGASTLQASRDVVIDRPGYRVRMRVFSDSGSNVRTVAAGDDNTFLWVQHQNRKIEGGRGDNVDGPPQPDPEPEPTT